MTQKNIVVPKTARYFILGEPSEQIEQLWIVCHGYGELASYFIKKFEVIATAKTLIVAPEALNRFYRQGLTGKVGASWMTKEERESEIADYINYLNSVYTEVMSSINNKKVKINILGFSQASAAVCRWVLNKRIPVDNLIIWGGFFPHDINYEKDGDFLRSLNSFIVVGKEDEFYSREIVDEQLKLVSEKELKPHFTYFEGKHEIHQPTLLEVNKKLL